MRFWFICLYAYPHESALKNYGLWLRSEDNVRIGKYMTIYAYISTYLYETEKKSRGFGKYKRIYVDTRNA